MENEVTEAASPVTNRSFLSARAIDVPDTRYKVDFELLDRYIGFSSELLRMALGGMAALGAIVALLTKDGELSVPLRGSVFVASALAALVMLAAAAGCALMHRYLASDGMYHHLRSIRYLAVRDHEDIRCDAEALSTLLTKAKDDEAIRNARYERAGKVLFASGAFLMAGVLSLGPGLVTILLG